MSLISYHRGQGSIVLRVKILNSAVSTGAGLTGLTSATSGLRIAAIADNEAVTVAYTQAGSTIETITTLGTYAAPTATKCRFKEVDATSHPGVYEIHLADTRYSVANSKSVLVTISGAANCAETDACIPLTDVNPYSGADGGITNLDALISSRMATYTQPAGFLAATFPSDPADQSLIIAATNTILADTNAIKVKTDSLTFTTPLSVDATASIAAASIRSAIGMSTNDLDAQLDAILAASGASGAGSVTYNVTVTDDSANPLDGAEVWVSTDSIGAHVVAGTLNADALGVVTFYLDPGSYYLWVKHSGFNGTNPTAITVT